jgi:hypothetical protein
MYPKIFFQNTKLTPQFSDAFVIMPFDKQYKEVFDTIAEAAFGVNFFCRLAKDVFGGGYIMEDILKGVGNSEVIIADLTGKNPNVFYELGIAHMVKNIEKVIMLTQSMDDVPFDLRPFRCVLYEQSPRGLEQLKRDLTRALNETSKGIYRFAVKKDEAFVFPEKFFGVNEDRAAYGFEITEIMILQNGAKISLKMDKYALGSPSKEVFKDRKGLMVGENWPMPHIPWLLTIENVSRDIVYFCIHPASSDKN